MKSITTEEFGDRWRVTGVFDDGRFAVFDIPKSATVVDISNFIDHLMALAPPAGAGEAVMSSEPRIVEHRCEVGCRPVCDYCERAKNPVGRDAPAAMGGDLCNFECPGYWVGASPCDLWPGEARP